MTNCIANSASPYLPLVSAGIGFLGALILYFLKERIDLKGRRREAIYFLLFFTNTLKKMISVGALPALAGGNFEESIRKLASAQLEYYDWPEVAKCWVPCDHVPIRSWPLFKARDVMRGVIESFKAEYAQ